MEAMSIVLGTIGLGLSALAVRRLQEVRRLLEEWRLQEERRSREQRGSQEEPSDTNGRVMAAGAAVLLVLSVWPLAGKALQGESVLWLIVAFGAAAAAIMGRWALSRWT